MLQRIRFSYRQQQNGKSIVRINLSISDNPTLNCMNLRTASKARDRGFAQLLTRSLLEISFFSLVLVANVPTCYATRSKKQPILIGFW